MELIYETAYFVQRDICMHLYVHMYMYLSSYKISQ